MTKEIYPVLGAHEAVSVSGTSAQTSGALSPKCYALDLVTTVAMHVKIGVGNQTATTDDPYYPAGVVITFSLKAGWDPQEVKIAAIRATTDGVLHVNQLEETGRRGKEL